MKKIFSLACSLILLVGVIFVLLNATITSKKLNIENLSRMIKVDIGSTVFNEIDFISYDEMYRKANTYLVTIYYGSFATLYTLEVNEKNEIVNLFETDIGGKRGLFQAKEISISQGDFIVVVGATIVRLYSLDTPYEVRYEFPARQYLKDYEYGFFEYRNGKLDISFEDINEDGLTDVILSGIELEYGKNGEDGLTGEFYCKFNYIYNPLRDNFEYNKNTSIYQKIS